MSIKNKLSVASIFSGSGGLDVSFASKDYEHMFANDENEDACYSFEKNIGDIEHAPLSKVKDKVIGLKDIDVFLGGPPCQGFSVAGKMDPNDERSKLSFEYMKIVSLLKPKVFVFENVKSLAMNRRWGSVFSKLVSMAEDSQYDLDVRIIKAYEYGVSQLRERLFIVGFNRNCFSNSTNIRDNFIKSILSKKKNAPPASMILSRKGKSGSDENPVTCNAKITYAKNPILRKSPFSGMLFNGSGRPVNPSYYFPTVSASMGGNRTPIIDEGFVFDRQSCFMTQYYEELNLGRKPRAGVAPNRLRRLTLTECKAIQTFSDDYEFVGNNLSQYRQIGNSVPPEISKIISESLLDSLRKSEEVG